MSEKEYHVFFQNIHDANHTLEEMHEILKDHKLVTISDFYRLVGTEVSLKNENIGWLTLDSAVILRSKNGYTLYLPKPVTILHKNKQPKGTTTMTDKDIKDTTINDVTDAAAEKFDDVKETASEKLDNLQGRARKLREDSEERLNDLSINQKLLLTGLVTVVVSTIVSKLVQRYRTAKIEGDIIIVTPKVDDEV